MKITVAALLSIGLFTLPAFAEPSAFEEIKTLPLKQAFGTTKEWHVTAYQPVGDDAETGDTSAKLCFWFEELKKQEHCTPIASTLPNGGMTYHYQTVKELAVIPAPHIIKFVAQFFGGGSGVLDQVSFWQYDKNTDSFSQAGLVTLTEQSEYKLFGQELVTANARWGEGETHFSPHRFDIEVYKYTPNGGYTKLFGYLTAKKYPSLDDTDKIDVISHEMPEIKKRLANAH